MAVTKEYDGEPDMATDERRRAYLKALDIDVYRLRGQEEDEHRATDAEHFGASLEDWDALRSAVSGCTRCALHQSRTQTVFGVGSVSADLMIVGEAPGAEEDRRGEPFVGRAGKLLDEMLLALGLTRDKVFIANILKCRPPNNRDPSPGEAAACRAYLDRQLALVDPLLVLAVGRIAAQQLLESDAPVGRLRGRSHTLAGSGLPVVVTYHPAYLLRSPTQKAKAWQDLILARRTMNEAGR